VIPSDAVEILLERFPPDCVCVMKFKLIYDGALPPDKDGMAPFKQEIRKQLHPQLRELWRTHPTVKNVPVEPIASGFARNGYRFVPLLRKKNFVACRLDMLLLMRQAPYGPISGGDLDNRVKTLIDGLKMPEQQGDLGGHLVPAQDENPFYCLLEDDNLLFEFQIRADQLLAPKREGQDRRDVVAVIEVHVMNGNRLEMATLGAGFHYIP
jgi:hypothetical protein